MPSPTISRFQRYVTVILRGLIIAVTVFASTFFAGRYITDNLLPKVYTATAQIQIHHEGDIEGLNHDSPGQNFNPIAYQADFKVMESPDFLLPVIVELGLDKAWADRIFKEDQLPPVQALDYMGKLLKFDVKRGTNIIEITASSDVPKEAANIANAIASQYKTICDTSSSEGGAQPGPVRIVSRAEIPEGPTEPNKAFCYIVTLLVAGFLSVTIASFVEIIFLFLRAAAAAEEQAS